METVLSKIFLERSEDGYQMRFGDLYNALTDYFQDHHVDYMKYNSNSVSTISMGVFVLLMCYKGKEEQRQVVRDYILELSRLINTTDYVNYVNERNGSFIESITSFFIKEDKDKDEKDFSEYNNIRTDMIPYVISREFDNSKYTDFYYIYKLITNLFYGGYHEEYIIQLSLSVLTFTNMIKDENNKADLLATYLIKLRYMDNLSSTSKYNFYDYSNSRVYIKF